MMKEKEAKAMDDDARDGPLLSIDAHAFLPLTFFLSLPLSLSLHVAPPLSSQVFISDIRAATNKEAEQTRVEKELAKIRKKFATGTAVTGES
jgi:hypothetical protein